jgi:hypothetical protein
VIPNSVTSIGDYAFAETPLNGEVGFYEGVTIGKDAFPLYDDLLTQE